MAEKVTIEGKVVENPYGNWSDVDKGVYVGGECIVSSDSPVFTFLDEHKCIGKNVRITLEVLEDETSAE